jgi:hypothetical protein
MLMFDLIICRVPLPDDPPAFIKPGHLFQSKDLTCDLRTYEITADGRIVDEDGGDSGRHIVEFYTSNIRAMDEDEAVYTRDGADAESVKYRAYAVAGKGVRVEVILRTREPAKSMAEFGELPELTGGLGTRFVYV